MADPGKAVHLRWVPFASDDGVCWHGMESEHWEGRNLRINMNQDLYERAIGVSLPVYERAIGASLPPSIASASSE